MQKRKIFQTTIDFSRPRLGKLILATVISALAILVADFLGPLAMAQILDLLQAGQSNLDQFITPILLFAGTQIFSLVAWHSILLLVWRSEVYIQRKAFVNIFDKLTRHSIKFHSEKFGGFLVTQSNRMNSAIEGFWDTMIFNLVMLVVTLVSAIVILFFKFWQYAIVLAFTSILFIVATILMSRHMPKNNEAEAKASAKMSGLLSDDIANILALKAFSAEKSELKLANKRAKEWEKTSLTIMKDVDKLMSVSQLINSAIRIAVIVVAIFANHHGLISIGTILLMITYTNSVTYRLHDVRGIIRSYNSVIGNATEMIKILDRPIEVDDKSERKLQITRGKIEFRNISFAHNKNDKLFQKFNLTIEPGQKVGLVGQSGSGKSSLASLLMRFYDVKSGQILIDGTNIAKVTQNSLRQAIAFVPQEPLMFHRSIAENIAFGKPNASLEEIQTAAKQACADDFIEKLPKKYQTKVGERGTKLSGGQRQRIAIARAIIKDAPILVLDEATSALDSESEKLIQDAMDELMIGRTALVVAHRLSTISKLDRIIVINNGQIVEDGSHEELIKKPNGTYAKLWQRQSGGFLTTDDEKETSEEAPKLDA